MKITHVAEIVKLSHVAEIVKLTHVARILEAGSMYDLPGELVAQIWPGKTLKRQLASEAL